MPEKPDIYRRFRLNLTVLILLIALTPFVLLSALLFADFSFLYRDRVEKHLLYRARAKAEKADFFLEERTAILSATAELHSFDDLIDADKLAKVFKAVNRRTGGFVDMGIIDGHGRHVVYVGPYDLQGLNYYEQPWFAEVMARGVYISDVYMGFRKIPHCIIAVRRQENQKSWILRATIDSDIFNILVREARTGRTGDAFIINAEGVYQTRPRFGSEIITESGLEPSKFGRGAVIEKTNPDGTKTLYAGDWLQNKNWLLVIRQNADEGMESFLKTRNSRLLLILMGCLGIIFVTILVASITVRRMQKLFRETGEKNAQLLHDEKFAAIGKMAAGIAHEVNNPLAAIRENAGWMADLLEDEAFRKSPNYEEYRASVQKIVAHVERAQKIVYEMLNYARKMEPYLEDVDINDVVEQTVSFVRNAARLSATAIETELEPDLPTISGSRAKLQQVLLNIINNAIEASGTNGRVHIKTALSDSEITVSVTDNGPGIPKDIQKKIFDPFFTTKETGKGTGLGLWICFHIVENMGGGISIYSEEGKGATFTVRLPIASHEKKGEPIKN